MISIDISGSMGESSAQFIVEVGASIKNNSNLLDVSNSNTTTNNSMNNYSVTICKILARVNRYKIMLIIIITATTINLQLFSVMWTVDAQQMLRMLLRSYRFSI